MATKPKQTPPPLGTSSLREASAALGITRAALLKLIDRGLPSILHREYRYVDIDAAREWIAARATEPVAPTMAAELHPDDPRAKQAAAGTAVKRIKLALDMGAMVTTESVLAIMVDALADLNGRMNALPSFVGPVATLTNDTARAAVSEAVVELLAEFKPDDESRWLDSPFESDSEVDAGEFEARHYQPILPASDPRAANARVMTQKLRIELDALESSSITVADARRIIREQADKVRKCVQAIPGKVAKSIQDGDPAHHVAAVLAYEVEAAKHAALIALGAKSDWKPTPPQPPAALDTGPVEDVDGDRMESCFEDAEDFEEA